MHWIEVSTPSQVNPRADLIRNLASGALGLVGTVVTVLVGWRKERDQTAQRSRLLEEASKRIAFWKAWSDAMVPMATSKEDFSAWSTLARAELLRASEAVSLLYPLADRAGAGRKISWWRRWLLLYRAHGLVEWFLHLVNHFNAIVALALLWEVIALRGARTDRWVWFWLIFNVATQVFGSRVADDPSP